MIQEGPKTTTKRRRSSLPNFWDQPEAKTVLDSMLEQFIAVDRDYNILYVNKAVTERTGRRSEEYIGHNHWKLWPSMVGTIVQQSFEHAFSTGIPVRFEYYFEPSAVWIDVNAYRNGDQLHIYFRDITKEKEAVGELARREASLRSVLDAIPHVAWATDAKGTLIYINARWEEYTGVNGMDGDALRTAIHPEDLPRIIEIMARSRASRTPQPYNLRLKRKDGEYCWHRVEWAPLLDGKGQPKQWIGTTTNVHEQMLALQALKDSEDRHRFRIDSSPQIPWLANAEGEIYESSAQWFELTGIKPEDMPAAQMTVLHPDDAGAMFEAWTNCLNSGGLFDFEHRIRVADGSYRWMRSRAVPRRHSDGSIAQWYGTTEDIHDRRVAEEALRESEARYRDLAETLDRLVHERTAELEAAYREQEAFSYSVSHDLRAPLRSIVASARILDEDYGNLLPAQAKETLKRQADAALKLAHLIDDLLELSRVGRQELIRRDVDLSKIFESVAEAMDTSPNLKFSIEPKLHARCDERLVRQLAQNLIENAVKFSPNGGTVRVGRRDGAFFVADEGIGFDPRYTGKLFQLFQRLHADSEFPGTGVGLASVKRIAERHGGRVWAEGEIGKGATFLFTLAKQAV